MFFCIVKATVKEYWELFAICGQLLMVRHNLYDQQLDLLMATRDSLYFFMYRK